MKPEEVGVTVMAIVSLLLLWVALTWILFPILALYALSKLREETRRTHAYLHRVEEELHALNERMGSANKMHGDLNRAAQWWLDREGADVQHDGVPRS